MNEARTAFIMNNKWH